MEYKPFGFNAGVLNVVSEELLIGSNAGGLAINATNIRLAVDFTVKRANQSITKYVGVAKSKRKQGGNAFAIGQGSGAQWMDVESTDFYHAGGTKFISQNLNLPAMQGQGMMYVTYYMWFKTQRIDTPIP